MFKNLICIILCVLLASCRYHRVYIVQEDLSFKRTFDKRLKQRKPICAPLIWKTTKIYFLSDGLAKDSNQIILVANKIYSDNLKKELNGDSVSCEFHIQDSVVYLFDFEN